MLLNTILFQREGFVFARENRETNAYSLSFDMENPNILLSKMVDFSLVKLIYDLNTDIYEHVQLTVHDDTHATMTALMKHLFEQVGLSQRFSHIEIVKQEDLTDSSLTFTSHSIYADEKPEGIPEHAEQMPIQEMVCRCVFRTPHHMDFSCHIQFEPTMKVPAFAEKMIGMIVFKLFQRVKQFMIGLK